MSVGDWYLLYQQLYGFFQSKKVKVGRWLFLGVTSKCIFHIKILLSLGRYHCSFRTISRTWMGHLFWTMSLAVSHSGQRCLARSGHSKSTSSMCRVNTDLLISAGTMWRVAWIVNQHTRHQLQGRLSPSSRIIIPLWVSEVIC